MYGLQIWPVDALFNSRKWSKWAGILSDSVWGGRGGQLFGGGGGEGESTLVMPSLQLKKIPFCMYVIDFSVRQLSNNVIDFC